MAQHIYDAAFMGVTSQSRRSAERIVECITETLQIGSVADFGCALGTWLSVWRDKGVKDLAGVDGDYLRGRALEIDPACVRFEDLSGPIDLGRRFDLVESLEVAEHLPAEAAVTFVETLTRHSDMVLFSAAPPGQGGEYHVNERPYAYWRDLFATQGYRMFDWIRPRIAADPDIRYWYRYNIFMFVRERTVELLPAAVCDAAVASSGPVADVSPLLFKMRKSVVCRLPVSAQNRIAAALARMRGAS